MTWLVIHTHCLQFGKWEGPGIINSMIDVEGREKVVRRSLFPFPFDFFISAHVESLGTRLLLIHKNTSDQEYNSVE